MRSHIDLETDVNLARIVTRSRYLVLAVIATGSIIPMWFVTRGHVTDFYFFVYGGRALIGTMPGYHGGPLHLYAQHPLLQIGPLPLLINSAVSWVPVGAQAFIWDMIIMALALSCVSSVSRTRVALGRSTGTVRHYADGLAVVGAYAAIAWYGHLDDAIAVAAIAIACTAYAERRPYWIIPVALGTAAMCKPWAVVVAPMLIVLPRRSRVRAILIYCAAAFAWWLPFVVADTHTVSALGSVRYAVSGYSGLRVLGIGPHQWATPTVHLLEFALGLGAASIAALRGRWYAVPLAALASRMLLEPRYYIYYGAGPLVAAAIWDASREPRVPCWTLFIALVEFGAYFAPAPNGALAIGQVCAAAAIVTASAWPIGIGRRTVTTVGRRTTEAVAA